MLCKNFINEFFIKSRKAFLVDFISNDHQKKGMILLIIMIQKKL